MHYAAPYKLVLAGQWESYGMSALIVILKINLNLFIQMQSTNIMLQMCNELVYKS